MCSSTESVAMPQPNVKPTRYTLWSEAPSKNHDFCTYDNFYTCTDPYSGDRRPVRIRTGGGSFFENYCKTVGLQSNRHSLCSEVWEDRRGNRIDWQRVVTKQGQNGVDIEVKIDVV